jgi:hypothetical protein
VGPISTPAIGRGTDAKDNRSVLSFDTSSLPDNAVITRAYVKVTMSSYFGNPWTSPSGNQLLVDANTGCLGSACTQETADWAATPTASSVASIARWTSGTTTSTDFNAAGLSAINKTGKTQIKLRFASYPSATNYVFITQGSGATLYVEYH